MPYAQELVHRVGVPEPGVTEAFALALMTFASAMHEKLNPSIDGFTGSTMEIPSSTTHMLLNVPELAPNPCCVVGPPITLGAPHVPSTDCPVSVVRSTAPDLSGVVCSQCGSAVAVRTPRNTSVNFCPVVAISGR